jgi:hypothetical protein
MRLKRCDKAMRKRARNPPPRSNLLVERYLLSRRAVGADERATEHIRHRSRHWREESEVFCLCVRELHNHLGIVRAQQCETIYN